ncbi:uncharacterized protein MONOS_715 [Monocercomonoides exilis]|uniref:uncharacterized protein n=1 Tax=Monocercomonoides exilis TaxID=2049356 RepID=UPI0035599DF1|nr:hypothetical protein MONOS_715 [Monocercomonoides exilis]|eukprot:MONOS_715.1-p1 / transcript=MONOS_715.1 / gene=MONOS_715 / organism=Monocercomonoides_exilis_PA203 / gene_product=unspecified product / transcript_product=unspecified product / location=Mono_scaffold00012:48774-56714(+) / protein_length=2623 / sequence_SO=supercontig / SO=protein_coding / is_pseudo=false
MNTSITFSKLQFQTRGGTNVVDGTLSNVIVLGSEILCNNEKASGLFKIAHGRALFNNMSLNTKHQSNHIPQLLVSEHSAKKKWIGDDFETIMLSSSTFSDLVFEKAPIIESSSSSSLNIAKCVFSNISSTQKKDQFCSETSELQKGNGAFIISGCEFLGVENVFYGGIGNNNHALNVFNTSVMHCARTMNSSSRVELKEDWSFENTEFANQHVTDYSATDIGFHTSGGAILFNGPSSTLSVQSCIFMNCSCSRWGGGICVVDSLSSRIANCSFDNCFGKRNNNEIGSHGGAIFVDKSQCYDIAHTIAKNGYTTWYGGAIYFGYTGTSILTDCNLNTLENGSPILLFNITCANETAESDYGGGLCVEKFIQSFFIMSECVFQNCSANTSHGGGIFIYVSPLEMNSKFCFYCFFFNNSASQASDVYLNDLDEKIKESPFVECYSLTAGESRCVSSSQGTKDGWLPNGFLVRYVIPDGGNNNALCGLTAEDGCSSLKFTLENELTKSRCRIMLIEGTYEMVESNGYVVFGKRISIQGRGKDLTQLSPVRVGADKVFLSVDDGICKLSSLSIVFDSHESSRLFRLSSSNSQLFLQELVISTPLNQEGLPSKEYLNSLFEVNFANFRMTDCIVENVLSKASLFQETSSASLLLSSSSSLPNSDESFVANSNFSHVTKTEGDGAVMPKTISEGESFCLWNTTIENCECSSGSGGGIRIDMTSSTCTFRMGSSSFPTTLNSCSCSKCGGGLYLWLGDRAADFVISSVSFVGCEAGEGGRDIFVNGSNMNGETINLEKICVSLNELGYEELMGFDRSLSEMGMFPLNVFLESFQSPAHVGGTEGNWVFDSNFCGFGNFPCQTIIHAAQLRFGSSQRQIVVGEGYELDEEMIMDGPVWNISCEEKGMVVDVHAPQTELSNQWLVSVSTECSIYNVCFSLPSSLSDAHSFITLSTSTSSLTLSNCSSMNSISESGSVIGFCFASVVGGELKMEMFETKGEMVFSSHSFIEGKGSSFAVNCVECVFEGITKENGDGAYVCVCAVDESSAHESEKKQLTIDNCTLNGCWAKGSRAKGGGLHVCLRGNDEMIVNGSSKFEGCCAGKREEGEEDGLGGGIFLSLEDEATQFVLLDMRFVGCCAWKGKNVFVNGSSLDEVVDSAHFSWEMSEKEKSSMDELCGWERSSTGVGFVIPLVVYLWSNFSRSGFVDGEEGGDFSGCGYAVAPCRSISHLISLKFTPLPGSSSSDDDEDEQSISVSHISSLTSSLSLSSSVESEQISMKFIGKDNESGIGVGDDPVGSEEWMIHSTIHLSFEVLSFHIPTAFAHHRTFIRSSTSSSLLQMKHCSFTPQSSSESVSFTLLSVSEGSLLIDNCSLSSFSTTHPFLLVSLPSQSITLSNMTVSNISTSSCSLVSFERTPSHLPVNSSAHNEVPDKPCCSLQIQSSSFANNTCSGDSATILCLGVFDAVESVVEKCTFSRCVCEASERGGALMMCVKIEESSVEVRQCSFTLCRCSTVVGRGGGMMFDCVDPSSPAPSPTPATDGPSFLPLKISEIRFTMNDALVGKDIFINCQSIEQQINETLFALDFTQESLQSNKSICASDADEQDVDLIPLITFLYAPQIFVCLDSADTRQCGLPTNPCQSISSAVHHIQPGLVNIIFINTSSTFLTETTVHGLSILPSTKQQATIQLSATIPHTGSAQSVVLFEEDCTVRNCLISFASSFEAAHSAVFAESYGSLEVSQCTFTAANASLELDSHVVSVWGGVLKMSETSFSWLSFAKPLLLFSDESEIVLSQMTLDSLTSTADVVAIGLSATVSIEKMNCSNISLNNGCLISTNKEELNMNGNGRNNDEGEGNLRISAAVFENISSSENNNNNKSVVRIERDKSNVNLINCSFSYCLLSADKGGQLSVSDSSDVSVVSCLFDGKTTDEPINHQKKNAFGGDEEENDKEHNPLCGWNGSVVDVKSSNMTMKDTTICNSKKGGISLFGGCVEISEGKFEGNNPSIQNYPSARRNILCEGSSQMNVVSLKGGDGVKDNSSLWILDGGCSLEGIAGERASPFFIPKVESVSSEKSGEKANLVFRGSLLLPCNLSFETVAAEGDEEVVEKHLFDDTDFISEEEVHGSVPVETIEGAARGAEVRVCILLGSADFPSATESFILKNKSVSESKGDERIAEGGKKEKSIWPVIVVTLTVLFLIVLIGFILFVVRWRKQKRRTRELEEIVNDTVKKDPKAFELVTMEISPEEQWRRAEREAEKKNEERIKKRVYENSLGHSESSEHLLSESGSTEYILGRDSDKIPEWALEKVDEKEVEEDTRKRTPSPSISSTSTTDSDSTFVRSESLCPTTSSMSNLVDAIACSSVFEKLIVDLRDSLFMLLHGRNEKKEMAIGTLKEREHTAAQVLFWVANGALHSLENEEDELTSLANLSPHIVLFSEHMIICIAKHSDFSSDDDSDSSSISSASTIITSSSDFSSANRNGRGSPPPSSAFEDEDDNRKECLRWKAPELQMNKKMGATKESVSFSIGMMLWECLTLQIPFGEYEAVVAGQKIVNGERPDMKGVSGNTFEAVVKSCVSERGCERVELNVLKREFIQHFPPGTVMVTMSDAIGYNEISEEEESSVSAEARKLIESMNK